MCFKMSKGNNKETIAGKAILDYLKKQNRPYSATDILNNLHKEYGKTVVVKVLESLGQEGKIKEKVYGKQKVYVADQDQFPEVDDSEIKAMDAKILKLTEQLKENLDSCKQLEIELKVLSSSITTSDAKQQLTEVRESCNQLSQKLSKLKEGQVLITAAEKEQVYSERTKVVKEWRKRKRMSKEILDAILEGYPKNKKQLFEEIGIETDEDYKVSPPEV